MSDFDLYFSLKNFAHAALWQGCLWDPLLLLDEYLRAQTFRIDVEVPAGVHLDCPEWISIGEGTVIEPGVLIQGPCIIGKGCLIRHGAMLRDGCILGERVRVGHASEIKHSVLFDDAAATHFTYVGDSIVGNRANLGAGVKCANFRLDRKEVSVSHDGKRIHTGLKKFGAIIGDGVQIGCNTVLNPGTLIGKESIIYPLLNFGGTIAPFSKIGGKLKPLQALMEKARAP